MGPHAPPDEAPSWFVIKLTATASLGGLLFGYDMGAISGALPLLQASFDLDEAQQQWLVSILYLGGGLGASVGGSLCDRAGRKRTIILTDIIFMLGAAGLYFAQSYDQVLVGRFVVGIGVAISGVADVSYLHECSPVEWRGAVVSVNEACISLGFLLAYIAGYVYSNPDKEEWRIIFGLAGVIALIQLIGMWSLPESPAWLAQKGRAEDARRARERINGGKNYSEGIEGEGDADRINPVLSNETAIHPLNVAPSLPDNLQQQAPDKIQDGEVAVAGSCRIRKGRMSQAEGTETYQHPKNELLEDDEDVILSVPSIPRNPFCRLYARIGALGHNFQSVVMTLSRYRRQVYIALFLAVTQQFCGQTSVLNYAPLIFSEAAAKDQAINNGNDNENGDSGSTPDWSIITIGIVKFVVTVLVIWRIEYVGRRVLLIGGTALIAFGLLALIIAFGGSTIIAEDDGQVDSGSLTWAPISNLKTSSLALPGILLVVCGYSMSFGPLTWLLTSELFPTDIRGRALGASTIITYLCASIVTRTFLSARSKLGPSMVFGIYCVITIMGVVFEYLAVPDTGEKSAEQIEHSLNEMYWWRFDALALSQIDQYSMPPTQEPTQIEMSGNPSHLSFSSLT